MAGQGEMMVNLFHIQEVVLVHGTCFQHRRAVHQEGSIEPVHTSDGVTTASAHMFHGFEVAPMSRNSQ
ncbi:hypothetical protein Y013_15060 [Rhodococcus pyridinivorans SB3094]|uniref:Uncharacterized protein n=1 Tax=Rhodococcus pyridinivorans SB3094 TaxID=1435356 RepID=V9XNU4_9NOCA|nr:hypothetical protein Y013_10940 [Rhodococcus pyridinivorans SB3094]AHD23800.1 hypothetical protein Y013_15060 [Rhodococcus pyridinivorans SB3094]